MSGKRVYQSDVYTNDATLQVRVDQHLNLERHQETHRVRLNTCVAVTETMDEQLSRETGLKMTNKEAGGGQSVE